MNVCLREADGELLRRSPAQVWRSPSGTMQTEAEAQTYQKLKTLMQLQFSGQEEQETLRQLIAGHKEKRAQKKADLAGGGRPKRNIPTGRRWASSARRCGT